ncbi:ATP synthase subunit I [Tuberibacillus calidus]|uniref:ATP synthase subunit I n=1 Tax=Tuberibacillus calidus TaxID=340097 RepID=UPI00056E5B1E|nr:ATP synthase subunit I [Tuberibacillus calidus]
MNELTWLRRIILSLTSCILLISILLWFLVPAKSLVAGFILGGAISLYNVLYLARRVQIAGMLVISGSTRRAGLGFFNRVLMIAFAIILAYRFPQWIDFRTLMLGIPLCYAMLVPASCFYVKKEKMLREGRNMLGNHPEN